jgi:hypothetical protein
MTIAIQLLDSEHREQCRNCSKHRRKQQRSASISQQ